MTTKHTIILLFSACLLSAVSTVRAQPANPQSAASTKPNVSMDKGGEDSARIKAAAPSPQALAASDNKPRLSTATGASVSPQGSGQFPAKDKPRKPPSGQNPDPCPHVQASECVDPIGRPKSVKPKVQ